VLFAGKKRNVERTGNANLESCAGGISLEARIFTRIATERLAADMLRRAAGCGDRSILAIDTII